MVWSSPLFRGFASVGVSEESTEVVSQPSRGQPRRSILASCVLAEILIWGAKKSNRVSPRGAPRPLAFVGAGALSSSSSPPAESPSRACKGPPSRARQPARDSSPAGAPQRDAQLGRERLASATSSPACRRDSRPRGGRARRTGQAEQDAAAAAQAAADAERAAQAGRTRQDPPEPPWT